MMMINDDEIDEDDNNNKTNGQNNLDERPHFQLVSCHPSFL